MEVEQKGQLQEPSTSAAVQLNPRDVKEVEHFYNTACEDRLHREARKRSAERAKKDQEEDKAAVGSDLLSTTAGGASDSEDSTKGLGKSSFGGDRSVLSSSRASCHKSSGTKRKKREALERKLERWAAEGKVVNPSFTKLLHDHPTKESEAQAREIVCSRMLHEVRSAVHEAQRDPRKDISISMSDYDSAPDSTDTVQLLLSLATCKQFSKEEIWKMCFSLPPTLHVTPQAFFLAEKECTKDGVCLACGKHSDEWHRGSATHKQRVEEQAIANLSLGTCSTLRRFSSHIGFVPDGVLTKAGFRSFWGSSAEGFNEILRQIHRKRGGINYRVSNKKSLTLAPRHVQRYVTRVASFDPEGGCKYKGSGHVVYDWDALPEDYWTVLGVDHATQTPLAPNHGYWPIVGLEPSEAARKEFGQYYYDVLKESNPAVCWYQSFWDPVVAWPAGEPNALPAFEDAPQGVFAEPSEMGDAPVSTGEPEVEPPVSPAVAAVLQLFQDASLSDAQRAQLRSLAERAQGR